MHEAKPVGSEQLAAKRKAPKAINRRFTQMDTERNPFKDITAEAQRIKFFLSRDDDKQNITQIRAVSFCPIVVSRLGKRDFLSVLGSARG